MNDILPKLSLYIGQVTNCVRNNQPVVHEQFAKINPLIRYSLKNFTDNWIIQIHISIFNNFDMTFLKRDKIFYL